MKTVKCGELIPGCNTVIEANTVDEVLIKVAEHAKSEHGLPTLPDALVMAAQRAIRDE